MLMLYFSGTGNSKYAAQIFCRNMNAECHSIEEKTDFAQMISSHDVIGFCYPVYGSRVPRIMREFVGKYIQCFKNKKLIIFCTQWLFSGDGARVFTDLFPRNYIDVISAEHFLMPNNVCNLPVLPLESESKIRKYLARLEKKMRRVCGNINNGVIKRKGFNLFSRFLGLFQGVFMPVWEKAGLNKVWIFDECNLCGLCVSICPMNNFENQNGKITAKGNCNFCYRCINKCPQKAIAVYLKTKVKNQYKGIPN